METSNFSSSRRSCLSKILVLPLIGLLSPQDIFAAVGNRKINATNSALNPMLFLMAAKMGMDLMAQFSGSKDSPMAAMMRYQTGLLNEIIGQLNNIQRSLVQIQIAIDSLPSVLEQAMEAQHRKELMAEIYGAVDRYLTVALIPSSTNPEIFNNEAVKEEIRNILDVADQKIATLNNQKIGFGPEACMIAPLAMCLSVAARTNLGFPTSVIKSSLNRYQTWFDDILGNKEGSISDILNKTIKHHDESLAILDTNPLAKRLGLSSFKLGGEQKGITAADPGLLLVEVTRQELSGLVRYWADEYGATTKADIYTSRWKAATYKRFSTIEAKYDSVVGAYLLVYNRSEPQIASRFVQETYELNRPKSGEYIYFQNIPHGSNFRIQDIKALAESGNTVARNDDASRETIKEAMSKANLDRATISFCAQARIVALQTKQRINDYLSLL